MRPTFAATWLILLSALAGCGGSAAPGPPVPLRTFILHDIQGLWGGHALWVAEDGTAIVQVVERAPAGQPGLWEKRYQFKLTDEQRAEVERLVGAHNFLALHIDQRPGVPDEAHPVIMVTTKTGTTAKVMKWAGDQNADFDPIYGYLLGLCHDGPRRQLVHEGPLDWDWRPAGFDSPW